MSSSTLNLKQLIRAGAGAGKTTTLVDNFIQFCKEYHLKFKKWPRVVVTTFTRKATEELKERLLIKALEMQELDLFDYISGSSALQISTIHGVLSLLLKKKGPALGLSSHFEIISDDIENQLIKQWIRENWMKQMEFQEVLERYPLKKLITLFKKYFHLKITQEKLSSITVEDYQKIAYQELVEFQNTTISLFKKLSVEIDNNTELNPKQRQEWFAYINSWLELDSFDITNLQHQNQRFKKPRFYKDKPAFAEHMHAELEDWRENLKFICEDELWKSENWQKFADESDFFKKWADLFYSSFLSTKISMSKITMQDLESLSYYLLKQNPISFAEFAKTWDYWMIDEYQDTSPLQVELLDNLIQDKPFFIVGDPQQSIYLFRGARSEIFHNKVLEVQQNRQTYLEKMKNYRSEKSLLHFFNIFFTKLSSQFTSMEPTKENSDSASVFVYQTEHEQEQIQSIIFRLQQLFKEGNQPQDIAILFRTHKMMKKVSLSLKQHSIPYQEHASGVFYQRREIKDAIFVLKFLSNPDDNINLIGLLRSPWFYIPDSTLIENITLGKESYWQQFLKNTNLNTHPNIKKLENYWLESLDIGPLNAFKKIITHEGFIDQALCYDSSGQFEGNLWQLIMILEEQERKSPFYLKKFLRNLQTGDLNTELNSEQMAASVVEPKKVQLMTIHASKGLQFKHIILPFLEQKNSLSSTENFVFDELSGLWSLTEKKDLLGIQVLKNLRKRETEESERVLYVASTRAQNTVSMMWERNAKKDSWADKINQIMCFSVLEGTYSFKDQFKYCVKLTDFLIESLSLENKNVPKIKQPWLLNIADAAAIQTTSFSKNKKETEFLFKNKNQVIESQNKSLRGIQLHRIYEEMQKYQNLSILQENFFLLAEDVQALKWMFQLKEIPFLEILKNGHAEWGYVYKQQNQKFQGQIDLWCILENKVWIIDYKTGSSFNLNKALEQLNFYYQALLDMNIISKNLSAELVAIYPYEQFFKKTTVSV